MIFICTLKVDKEEGFVMVSPSKNQSIHNDVLEGWFSKQGCRKHQQGVEPTAGYKMTAYKVRVTNRTTDIQFIFFLCGRAEKNKLTHFIFIFIQLFAIVCYNIIFTSLSIKAMKTIEELNDVL